MFLLVLWLVTSIIAVALIVQFVNEVERDERSAGFWLAFVWRNMRQLALFMVLIAIVTSIIVYWVWAFFYVAGVLVWFVPGTAGMVDAIIVVKTVKRHRRHRENTIDHSCYDSESEDEEYDVGAPAPGMSLRETIYQLIADKPYYRDRLEEVIEWEESHTFDNTYDGWTWSDVHTNPAACRYLVSNGIANITLNTRRTTCYRLVSRDDAREAIEMAQGVGVTPVSDSQMTVQNLFRQVVGHERAKAILRFALQAPKPVHCLLVGPPGGAKTLLISDIGRLPGAEFYAGSTTTKAGLVGLLLRSRPKYLVIDEIDKMAEADMTPLLNLMEGGIVTQLQSRVQQRVHMDTRVFAAANKPEKISAPVLSRFAKLEFPAYTPSEFRLVTQAILTQREGIGPQVAELIANEVVRFSTDIRDAIRVASLAAGHPQDIPLIVSTLFPGEKVRQLSAVKTP